MQHIHEFKAASSTFESGSWLSTDAPVVCCSMPFSALMSAGRAAWGWDTHTYVWVSKHLGFANSPPTAHTSPSGSLANSPPTAHTSLSGSLANSPPTAHTIP
eukprot:354318-Chlamydomonas_euryale.AAC.19